MIAIMGESKGQIMFRVISAFVLTSCLLFVCACAADSEAGRVSERIRSSCTDANTCQIRIRDPTDFEWDRMYVFDYGAELYDIEQAVEGV